MDTSVKEDGITNTVVRIKNSDGLNELLIGIETALKNIYDNRKSMVSGFRKELFVQKVKNEHFANWNMDDEGNITIKNKKKKKQPGPSSPFVEVDNGYDSSYEIREYHNNIRYAYRKVIGNLQNARRSIKLALKFDGEVEIPGDVLNNIEFFGDDPQNFAKVQEFGVRAVHKFFSKHSDTRKL